MSQAYFPGFPGEEGKEAVAMGPEAVRLAARALTQVRITSSFAPCCLLGGPASVYAYHTTCHSHHSNGIWDVLKYMSVGCHKVF